MSKGMPWNPCLPDGAQAGGGGGGGFDPAFAAHRDLSVNGARVDGLWSGAPVLRTQTDLNNAGAYNGGGTGNKAGLPAGSIPAITPAIMVIMGDSSFRVMQAKAILEMLVNGAPQ